MDKLTKKRIKGYIDGINERLQKLQDFIFAEAIVPDAGEIQILKRKIKEKPEAVWKEVKPKAKVEKPAAVEAKGEVLAAYKDGAWFCADGRHKDFHGVKINEIVAHLVADHGLSFDETKDGIEEFTHARRWQAKQYLIKQGLMTAEGGRIRKAKAIEAKEPEKKIPSWKKPKPQPEE